VLCAALARSLPAAARFRTPAGGYFVWIRLPHPAMTGAALLDACVARHAVRFQPGERFGAGLDNFIRLSFSYYPRDDLALGAERLGRGMAEMLSALEAGPAAPLAAAAPAPAALPVLGVHGATGRLGKLVLESAAAATAWGGVAALPRGALPAPAGGAGPTRAANGDVSLPAGTAALLAALLALPAGARAPALVVGTTGDLPLEALAAYAKRAPVALCANFSTGVPLLLKTLAALKGALPAGWHAEVVETHHTAKLDAPSGTAKRILAALAGAGVGGGVAAAVPCHALRLGDTVGEHTVYLAGPGERLAITHSATRRDVFAQGALRWAAWALAQPPGLYTV
jgi:4-hydroxy-tetrahydrodipicolinate reductase